MLSTSINMTGISTRTQGGPKKTYDDIIPEPLFLKRPMYAGTDQNPKSQETLEMYRGSSLIFSTSPATAEPESSPADSIDDLLNQIQGGDRLRPPSLDMHKFLREMDGLSDDDRSIGANRRSALGALEEFGSIHSDFSIPPTPPLRLRRRTAIEGIETSPADQGTAPIPNKAEIPRNPEVAQHPNDNSLPRSLSDPLMRELSRLHQTYGSLKGRRTGSLYVDEQLDMILARISEIRVIVGLNELPQRMTHVANF